MSLLHLIAEICAIVGGVFTVAGVFDRFVYAGVRKIEQKFQMGKLS